MVDKHIDKLIETRDILNDVGNGFCLQKWRNVTLYLHMGDNHSCYHPQPNRVPVEEVLANPKAIHNSKFKKQVRKEMLEGKKPSECYYCWNVEELEGNHYSDRMIHNSSTWLDAKKETEEIRNMPWDADVNPYYVEVSFGAGCNFKCGYCCPQASSQWQDEIEKHGNYDISFNQYGIDYLEHTKVYKDDEYNPYFEAWWEWWPELKKDLKVLRLTGGEALLNPNTMKMFKLIQESDDCQHLEINLNSNMGVSTGRVTRLAEAVKAMLENKKIKDFKLYTSLEAWDERAEYMRRGLRMKQWVTNVETYLEIVPDTPISVMCTYNILSVASFRPFLENILRLRKKWNKTPGNNRIIFDTPYLKEPPHWMINLLPQSFGKYIDEDLQFISDNISTDGVTGFWDVEYEKLKRVRDYFYQGGARVTDKVIRNGRKDFYNFFTEYDKRSDLSLLQTFPEYEDFYYLCQELVESDAENLIPVKEI